MKIINIRFVEEFYCFLYSYLPSRFKTYSLTCDTMTNIVWDRIPFF